MRKLILILTILSILLLITAGLFGYNLQMGFFGERSAKFVTAHKHSATLAALVSIVTHVLALTQLRKKAES